MTVTARVPSVENTVIRTSPRWDRMVKHLGYISVDVDGLPPSLITDKQLVKKSQEVLRQVKIPSVGRLKQHVVAHLTLARAIADIFPEKVNVYAAIIPPASDRVRTAGLYDRGTREIMLHLETLESGRDTVDAMVHELGHHIADLRVLDPMQAEDLQPAHSDAMTYVSARVFDLAAKGQFDEYLKEAVW